MNAKTIARFWAKVDKNGPVPAHMPHLGQCWVWKAYKDRNGYGRFGIAARDIQLAHRVAFVIEYGDTLESAHVLHRCDNPSCVRVSHLFLGDMTANMADKVDKGRQAKGDRAGFRSKPESVPRGENHWRTRLTEEDVAQIRAAYAGRGKGPTLYALSRLYGVSGGTVGEIVKGKAWAHSASPHTKQCDQRYKLTDADVQEMRAAYRRGDAKQVELARRFGVTQATVSLIIRGESRKQSAGL